MSIILIVRSCLYFIFLQNLFPFNKHQIIFIYISIQNTTKGRYWDYRNLITLAAFLQHPGKYSRCRTFDQYSSHRFCIKLNRSYATNNCIGISPIIHSLHTGQQQTLSNTKAAMLLKYACWAKKVFISRIIACKSEYFLISDSNKTRNGTSARGSLIHSGKVSRLHNNVIPASIKNIGT